MSTCLSTQSSRLQASHRPDSKHMASQCLLCMHLCKRTCSLAPHHATGGKKSKTKPATIGKGSKYILSACTSSGEGGDGAGGAADGSAAAGVSFDACREAAEGLLQPQRAGGVAADLRCASPPRGSGWRQSQKHACVRGPPHGPAMPRAPASFAYACVCA